MRRSRGSTELPADRVIWSASEHLVVEATAGSPSSRRSLRWIGLVVVLAACASAIALLLINPPGPALLAIGASRTPTGWLQHYADRLRRRLVLVAMTEHHTGVAYLEVNEGHDRVVITLYKQGGLWKAAQEQRAIRQPTS